MISISPQRKNTWCLFPTPRYHRGAVKTGLCRSPGEALRDPAARKGSRYWNFIKPRGTKGVSILQRVRIPLFIQGGMTPTYPQHHKEFQVPYKWRVSWTLGDFGGWVFPFTDYIGEDYSILDTWNVWSCDHGGWEESPWWDGNLAELILSKASF